MFSAPIIYIQVEVGSAMARRLGNASSIRRESAALSHPRTLMGDFLQIQKLFKELLAELKSGISRPKVLVHLLPEVDGGYTSVEERAFLEAAHAAGARAAKIVVSDTPLSDAQVRQAFQ